MRHIRWEGNCNRLRAVIEGGRYTAVFDYHWKVYREDPNRVIRSHTLILHYESFLPGMHFFVPCNKHHEGRCSHCHLRHLLATQQGATVFSVRG